jgi:D-arabinose 5-phosphate isomerase GutQ
VDALTAFGACGLSGVIAQSPVKEVNRHARDRSYVNQILDASHAMRKLGKKFVLATRNHVVANHALMVSGVNGRSGVFAQQLAMVE